MQNIFQSDGAWFFFCLHIKQKGALSPAEVCEAFGLFNLRNRRWHIQGTCAPKGEGLYEGLDWLASALKEMQAAGIATSVGGSGISR